MYVSQSLVRNALDITCLETIVVNLQAGFAAHDEGKSSFTTRYLWRWLVSYATPKAYQTSIGAQESAIELRFWPGVHITLDNRLDLRIRRNSSCLLDNWYSRQLQSSENYRAIGGIDRLTLVLNQALLTIVNTVRLSSTAEAFNSLGLIVGWEYFTVNGFDYCLPKLLIPTNNFKHITLAEKVEWARLVCKLMAEFQNDDLARTVSSEVQNIHNQRINQDALELQSIAYRHGAITGYQISTKPEKATATSPEEGLDINRGYLFPEHTQKFFL